METESLKELEQRILAGDTDAMVNMAIIINGGQTHPFFSAESLLQKAKEMGNKRAISILEGRNEDEESSFSLKSDDVEGQEEDTDSLLSGRYYYRIWKESDFEERNEQDREKSIELFELAVKEFEGGAREMDEELKEGIVIITEYYYNVKKDIDKAYKYNKIGADAGQETLAYTWAMHLKGENKLDEAIHYFEKALYGELTYLRVHYMLAMLYLDTKGKFHPNKEKTLKIINEGINMLEEHPDTINEENLILYVLKGDYFYKIKENKKAIIAYKSALDKIVNNHGMPQMASMAAGKLSELYGLSNKQSANKYSMLSKLYGEKKSF